mmetsp:Transcript_25376/g.80109  ORF Transcript_25376/g.80109 Transcript_25376/m.80109 type:complete len:232 (-) Transcript_25376:3601-4296(-)
MPYCLGDGTSKSAQSALSPAINFEPAVASSSPAAAQPIAVAAWAYRRGAPPTEKAVTAGRSIALERPCGTWKAAPMGLDMPWIRVTDAFEKAMPACVAAAIRVSRAAAPPAVFTSPKGRDAQRGACSNTSGYAGPSEIGPSEIGPPKLGPSKLSPPKVGPAPGAPWAVAWVPPPAAASPTATALPSPTSNRSSHAPRASAPEIASSPRPAAPNAATAETGSVAFKTEARPK